MMSTCDRWSALGAGVAAGCSALLGYPPEVEPNDNKTLANAYTLSPGDTVTGTTTGTSTVTPGPASADTFLIKTAAAPQGVYRYTMTLTTTGTAGHTATLRGLAQSAGVITPGTDVMGQQAWTAGDGSRQNVWYGFGHQERVYYRVAGVPATTALYTATLTRVAVTPTPLGVSLPSGSLALLVTMTGAASDPDIWVYNADTMAAVGNFGNDDTPGIDGGAFSTLVRSFPPGNFLLAVTDYNLMNNQASPLDDGNTGAAALDFPDISVASDQEGSWTATVEAHRGDVTGPILATVPLTQTQNFEIKWLSFTVSAACPADIGMQGGLQGADGVLDNNDFVVFINDFFTTNPIADFGRQGGLPGSDGMFDNNDFVVFINQFFQGCSG